MSGRTAVLVLVRARAGAESAVSAAITHHVGQVTLQEPDCVEISAHRHLEDPRRFMVYQIWADRSAYDAFSADGSYDCEFHSQLTDLVDESEVTLWKAVE